MNKARDVMNPYEIPRVILAAVTDEIQLDENLEPPFVRVRDTNSQYLEIDARNIPATENPCRITQTLSRTLPRINRLRFQFLSLRYMSPNINPRNNTFSFVRAGVPFVATITADQNLIGLARYQALAAAMSTAVGVPGQFTAAAGTLINQYIITNTAALTWRFSPISQGILRGRHLWGFNETNWTTEATTQSLIWYTENYTRWLDFGSAEMTQYTKTDISGTDIGAEVFYRAHTLTFVYGNITEQFIVASQPSLNFDRSRSLSVVDITIRDEFGELLYIPIAAWGSFSFNISFLADM